MTTGTANTNYAANQLNQATAKQGHGPTRFSGTIDEPARVTVSGQSATVMSDGGVTYVISRG
ncbi:MAG: hypothetical protein ACPGGN_05750 [Opitutales bacterium]